MNASSSDEVPSYSMYKYARARKRWAVVYTSLILLSRLFVFGDGELAGRNGLIINLLLGDVCTAFLQFVFFFFSLRAKTMSIPRVTLCPRLLSRSEVYCVCPSFGGKHYYFVFIAIIYRAFRDREIIL